MTDKAEQSGETPHQPKGTTETLRDRVKRQVEVTAKQWLPNDVIKEVRQYRAYKRVERPLYLKTRILSGVGLLASRNFRVPATARSFVFVCFGNIIRSPMCEALMNQAIARIPGAQVKITSAGLNAVAGRAAHPWAIATAPDFGVSLEDHRARLLTPEMVNQADVIFAMDYHNRVQLLSRHPQARARVFMLSAYGDEEHHSDEIPDPYYMGQEQTRYCYRVLQTCIRNLVCSFPQEHWRNDETQPGKS